MIPQVHAHGRLATPGGGRALRPFMGNLARGTHLGSGPDVQRGTGRR